MNKMELTDKILPCKDCNKDFTFKKEEQSFYLERAYAEPKRCDVCRKRRKRVRRRNRRSLIRSLSASDRSDKEEKK